MESSSSAISNLIMWKLENIEDRLQNREAEG